MGEKPLAATTMTGCTRLGPHVTTEMGPERTATSNP